MHRSRKFRQRGSNFDFLGFFFLFLLGKRGSKYHYKRAINGLPAKLYLNGVSLACRCCPIIEMWFGSFVIFHVSEQILLRNPIGSYMFVIFQGGSSLDPLSHPLDPHMLLTFIKLQFVIKIFVLSIFEWLFYTGFTVCLKICLLLKLCTVKPV